MADRKVGLDTLQAWQKAREFVIFVHQQIIPVLLCSGRCLTVPVFVSSSQQRGAGPRRSRG